MNFIFTEERLKLLWPTKVDGEKNRMRRSLKGHLGMDYPTAETALMTISFLTLAVFLIKLVLVSVSNESVNKNTFIFAKHLYAI